MTDLWLCIRCARPYGSPHRERCRSCGQCGSCALQPSLQLPLFNSPRPLDCGESSSPQGQESSPTREDSFPHTLPTLPAGDVGNDPAGQPLQPRTDGGS